MLWIYNHHQEAHGPGETARAVPLNGAFKKSRRKDSDAAFELVDIEDFNLPLLDGPLPPSLGTIHEGAHENVGGEDRFLRRLLCSWHPNITTARRAALKNAIDFLYKEWNNKAAGFVAYGSTAGRRAVEQLRPVMAEVLTSRTFVLKWP